MLYVHHVAVKGIYSLLTCLSEAEHAGAGGRDVGEKALSVQERSNCGLSCSPRVMAKLRHALATEASP